MPNYETWIQMSRDRGDDSTAMTSSTQRRVLDPNEALEIVPPGDTHNYRCVDGLLLRRSTPRTPAPHRWVERNAVARPNASRTGLCCKKRRRGPLPGRSPQLSAEWQIYELLKRLPADQRRSMLARRFTQCQRLALERWIVLNHDGGSARNSIPKEFPNPSAKGVREDLNCSKRRDRTTHYTAVCDDILDVAPVIRSRSKSRLHGIHSCQRGGRPLYCASIIAGPFLISTKFGRDLPLVLRFREVLLAIQVRLASVANRVGMPSKIEAEFRAALVEEPATQGLDPIADMGLRFVALVAAKYWVGNTLRTPRFRVSNLDHGVQAWLRLNEARALIFQGRTNRFTILRRHTPLQLSAAWARLRETYIDVWVQAGCSRETVVARLCNLEKRHQCCRQRMTARWHASNQAPKQASTQAIKQANKQASKQANTQVGKQANTQAGKHASQTKGETQDAETGADRVASLASISTVRPTMADSEHALVDKTSITRKRQYEDAEGGECRIEHLLDHWIQGDDCLVQRKRARITRGMKGRPAELMVSKVSCR